MGVVSSRTLALCIRTKHTMNCGEDLLEIVRLDSVLEYVHSFACCFCAIFVSSFLLLYAGGTRNVCLHFHYYSVLLYIYHYLFKSGKYYICAFTIQCYCT